MGFDINSDSFNYIAKMVYREPGPGEERVYFATMAMRAQRAAERAAEERVQRKQERVWLHVE